VAESLNVGPDDRIDIFDAATACALIDGIIRVECAGMPYAPETIAEGVAAAT
jgi:hypothetical protein